MNAIEKINQDHIAKLMSGKIMPEFSPGDTVRVMVKVTEGDKSRLQAYVNEFAFRFNHRDQPARMFGKLLNQISRV